MIGFLNVCANSSFVLLLLNLLCLGSNTHDAIQQFHNRVVLMKPRVVIIGLSLANEGMDVDSFLSNMKYLISDVKKLGAACMLGSVYPNNYYTRAEYEMLLSTHKEMIKWKQDEIIDALFDFMVLDDGKGHWKSSCYADAGHPNEVGHKIMFESIDLNIFSRFRPAHSKM